MSEHLTRRVAFAGPDGRVIGVRELPAHVADNLANRWTVVDISAAEAAAINAGGWWRVDEGHVVEGQPDAEHLPAVCAQAQAIVDAGAEMARLRFVTTGAGQAHEYEETAREAMAVSALVEPLSDADWPFLAAEKAAQAAAGRFCTISEIADEVRRARAASLAGLARIKLLRRQAKLAIQAATNEAEVRSVINALVWPGPEGAA